MAIAKSFATQTASTLAIQQGVSSDISAFYGISNVPLMAYDNDVVGGELFNVMSTLIGDEIFEPTYGCNLPRRIFEPINGKIEQLCKQDVFFAAKEWVPQVTVNIQQTVVVSSADNRVTGVGIVYNYAGGGWLQPVGLFQSGT